MFSLDMHLSMCVSVCYEIYCACGVVIIIIKKNKKIKIIIIIIIIVIFIRIHNYIKHLIIKNGFNVNFI